MKKISLVLFGMFLFFGSIALVSADTATTTDTTVALQAQITQLLQQIDQLKAQLANLQKSNTDLQNTVTALQITNRLSRGSRGDDVKHLQEVLATDKDIFSKDNITGYYGPMTEQAVKYFQKHFGIDPIGVVGPITLEKINELLKEHNVNNDEDLQENDLGELGNVDNNNNNDGETNDDNNSTSNSNGNHNFNNSSTTQSGSQNGNH